VSPWTPQPFRVESRIRIEPDGTVVALSGKIEYGQGIRTAFATIVAGELGVPFDRVRVVLGETDEVPWDMGTFGSMSVANDGAALRRAAAFARERLLDRAAGKLTAPRSALDLSDGIVRGPQGSSLSLAELAAAGPIPGEVPDDTPLRVPDQAADAPRRLEALAIVTGAARFAGDVRLPGLLRGHALEPPVFDARLRSVDDRAARAMPGVVAVVHEDNFAGVVADRADQALAAVRVLDADWDPPPDLPPAVDLVLRHDEGVAAAFAGAVTTLEARFVVPHVAHASIGPSAGAADVRADGTDIYTSTQRPFPLRDDAARLLGVPPDRVHVHAQFASGTYGRNGGSDAALEAVRLSRAVGRPVLVQWTRAEEFRSSPNRPEVTGQIAAALDARGQLTGWRYEAWTNPHAYGRLDMPPDVLGMTSGRNAIPPYRVPADVRLHVAHAKVRTGALRSLAAAPNVFAIESFMDEIASRAGADPFEFRLRHIEDPRLRRVLEAVRDRSGWASRAHEAGRGLGVACTIYHGTYVAEVAEVTVAPGGRVRLERVWCAVDPGRLVHPDGARNQAEGAIQQAASWALLEQVRHVDGRVAPASFDDYPIATFRDAPRHIDVTFTADATDRSTGMGEPCSVPVAAALANAVVAAGGARVRTLPLTPAAVRPA
jgi:nicotinate dehydrogenase subunit B